MNETNYSVKSASSCPVKFLLAKKDIICCSKCPFIPFIELKEKDNNIIVSLICQNQHKEEKDIYTFLNDIKNIRPNKNTCEKCNQLQNNKTNPISYCLNCNLILCDKCKSLHQIDHSIIFKRNINSHCIKHLKKFKAYCINCNLNLCNECIEEHESHKTVDLNKNLIQEEEIERYKKLIKTSENHLSNIQNTFNSMINMIKIKIENLQKLIKQYIIINNLEIKFAKEIISIYQNEESVKNINYQIIMNVRNNLRFSFAEIPKNDNIFKQSLKFEEYLLSNNNILYIKKKFKKNIKNNVIASLICNFSNKENEQRKYCLKIKDNIKYPGDIGYEMKSYKEDLFSIELDIKGKKYILQNEKIYTKEMMEKTINKLYYLLKKNIKI